MAEVQTKIPTFSHPAGWLWELVGFLVKPQQDGQKEYMTYPGFLYTDRLKSLAKAVTNRFQNNPSAAYLHHSFRVANYASRIAGEERIDVETATAAALVHDIGMVIDTSYAGHVAQTAALAPTILFESGFSDQQARRIAGIAASHHPAPDGILRDIYEQVLFDADTLEVIGVFGSFRWFGAVPQKLAGVSESANLFLAMNEAGRRNRGDFFYTDLARRLGHPALDETVRLCHALIAFVDQSESFSAELAPIAFRQLVSDRNLQEDSHLISMDASGRSCRRE